MKNKWILAGLLLAALVAFWFLGRPGGEVAGLGAESYALTEEILAFGPRPPGSDALDQVKARLADELRSSGWETTLQEFERQTPVGKVKLSNLRARMKVQGKETWSRDVEGLLCAHIDSKNFKDRKFLGADDAASACAAIVAMGKQLAENDPARAQGLELVFFDGEEAFAEDMTLLDGLYGSRHYANLLRTAPNKPKFGILLDMVGHRNLTIAIPSDSPKKLADLMFSVAKDLGSSTHFSSADGPIMDDHLPLNLIGIPTLDIIGDFANEGWWHTAGDNASVLSAESLDISTAVVMGMLKELLPGR